VVQSMVVPATTAFSNRRAFASNLGRSQAPGSPIAHAAPAQPRRAVRDDATEAASHDGSWPAGGSFTTRADFTPGQAATAATA